MGVLSHFVWLGIGIFIVGAISFAGWGAASAPSAPPIGPAHAPGLERSAPSSPVSQLSYDVVVRMNRGQIVAAIRNSHVFLPPLTASTKTHLKAYLIELQADDQAIGQAIASGDKTLYESQIYPAVLRHREDLETSGLTMEQLTKTVFNDCWAANQSLVKLGDVFTKNMNRMQWDDAELAYTTLFESCQATIQKI